MWLFLLFSIYKKPLSASYVWGGVGECCRGRKFQYAGYLLLHLLIHFACSVMTSTFKISFACLVEVFVFVKGYQLSVFLSVFLWKIFVLGEI